MKQIDVINHSSGCVVAGGYSSGRITFEKAIDDRWDLTKRVEEMLSAHDLIGRKPTCYSFRMGHRPRGSERTLAGPATALYLPDFKLKAEYD